MTPTKGKTDVPMGDQPAASACPWPSHMGYYLRLHFFLLLGYATLGKYFAYLNIGNVYVGEIVLIIAMGVFLFKLLPYFKRVLIAPTWCLLLFMTWGAIRTVPYLTQYGPLSLRDGVIWGYGFFAIVLATYLIARPSRMSALIPSYRRFIRISMCLVPIVWLLTTGLGMFNVTVNDRNNPVLKGGDLMTHLAGVTAFLLLQSRPSPWLALTPIMFMMSMNTRGGLLSFCLSMIVVFGFKPLRRRWLLFLTPLTLGLALFILFDIHVTLPDIHRDLSAETLWQSVQSIYGESDQPQYQGTKEWRLSWWNKIIDYTIRGPYFWVGKGFGVNIAYSDGFAAAPSDPLRSPHSCHFTVLARSGVPGLVLWVATQLTWAIHVFRCIRLAQASGDRSSLFLFQFLLVYWAAFLVNGSFDVFLEGPMAGIWFWSIFGVGIACGAHYRRLHELAWQDVRLVPAAAV